MGIRIEFRFTSFYVHLRLRPIEFVHSFLKHRINRVTPEGMPYTAALTPLKGRRSANLLVNFLQFNQIKSVLSLNTKVGQKLFGTICSLCGGYSPGYLGAALWRRFFYATRSAEKAVKQINSLRFAHGDPDTGSVCGPIRSDQNLHRCFSINNAGRICKLFRRTHAAFDAFDRLGWYGATVLRVLGPKYYNRRPICR